MKGQKLKFYLWYNNVTGISFYLFDNGLKLEHIIWGEKGTNVARYKTITQCTYFVLVAQYLSMLQVYIATKNVQ